MCALPPKADIGSLATFLKCDRRKYQQHSRGAGSRAFTLHKVLPSKFRRDFVILGGLRVVTPDRSALLLNRRLLGRGMRKAWAGFLVAALAAASLALPFVFIPFLGTPVLALNANDLRNNLVKIPRFSPVAASRYVVDGLSLGGHVNSGNQASRPYQCRPSDKFPGLIWCHEEHATPDNEVMRSHSILQSQDGTAYYVSSYFQPAFFDPNDIQNEIDRMSSEFGQQARIIRMSQREGLPSAVMAIWGAVQLELLKPDEISVVASGGSPPGILFSFLGDEERSAKAGVPVYRLAGGAGFLWVATFDQNGRGVLQYLAIDDSKIESSRQVISNSETHAESNSSAVNPTVVTPPGLRQQSRSQTEDAQTKAKEDQYRQEEEKRQVEEADRQLKEAHQLLDPQQNRRLATITEVAITVFVLLCGVAVAVLLRVKRPASQ